MSGVLIVNLFLVTLNAEGRTVTSEEEANALDGIIVKTLMMRMRMMSTNRKMTQRCRSVATAKRSYLMDWPQVRSLACLVFSSVRAA